MQRPSSLELKKEENFLFHPLESNITIPIQSLFRDPRDNRHDISIVQKYISSKVVKKTWASAIS